VGNYSSTQAASYVCIGSTKGYCFLFRVQAGSMPAGRGCSGDPETDSANASCLTAGEQDTLEAWILGGQLP
jgi:hypothetical protein